MAFELQNPDDPKTSYLLDFLLDACNNAEAGGGAFAFVTPPGVNLFIGNKAFERFKSKHTFDLVVGTDAITSPKSLKALTDSCQRLKGLNVRAFLNARRGKNSFHPKFCWFRTARGGTLITGSGNLTGGGLMNNWEAFAVEDLSISGAKAAEKWWTDWKASSASQIRTLTDAEVVARVTENARQPIRRLAEAEAPEIAERNLIVAAAKPGSDVLIAEIPRGGPRWNQTNVDRGTFESYFHARVGGHKRIFLYHVEANGSLQAPEPRVAFRVKSHNYRFEIGAASGLAYPAHDRPIAVFVKVAARVFRYRLLMPDDPTYPVVSGFLAANAPVVQNRMRRIQVTAAQLKAAWPNSPLWAE